MAEEPLKSAVVPKKRRTANQLEDEERWNVLSTIVALEGIANGYHESHVDYSKGKGSLVVIGSGIKCVGQFSLEAISHLKNADKVLYCVADPATEHFIRELCPDALDLYVLYANGKKRYETYVQMAEATLYYARQGLRTVMVFYGHPGIFVMPSHRAMKIAQQQGIETYMLPAISALDCLVADLNIDPSYPGMVTLEATDLLLRNRTLLTDLHVIVWQVGCVGDLGFVRTGYKNQFLSVLIEHIQGIYGKDYIITHYIGAQYPMCSPTIAKLPLSKILEPDIMKTITGISTFYIPPKVAKEIIPANAQQLDITLASDGSTGSPLVRQYARCGPREKKAIHDLLDWKVPEDYKHSTFTKVGEYLGKLAQDVGLFHKHKKAPVKTMRKAGLATMEVSTMLMASPNQVNKLMKSDANSVAMQVAIRILTDPKFASALNDTINKHVDDNDNTKVNEWLAFKGYQTTLKDVYAAFTELRKTSLLPWTSVYTTNQSITLTIVGQAPSSSTPSKVLVDATEIKQFTFTNQTLTWSSSNGNSSSAELVFATSGDNHLNFTGKYWSSTNQKPAANNISGQNSATKASFSNWVGSYTSTLNSMNGPSVTVYSVQNSNYRVLIENIEISHYTFGSDNSLSWSDSYNTTNGNVIFSVENAGTPQVRRVFRGYYWGKGSTKPPAANFSGVIKATDFTPYLGMYSSYYKDNNGASQYGKECFMATKSNNTIFTIGTTAIKSPKYSMFTITWSTSGGNADNGSVTFHIDPQKHIPAFRGKRWTGSTKPTEDNLWGNLDTTYLKEWAGVYTTYSQYDSSWSPGAQVIVNSATTPSEIQVTFGSTAVKSPVFNNPVLTWSKSDGNATNAYIIFYYPQNSTVPKFYGKMWFDTQPTKDNLIGEIDSKYLQSWTGRYATYFADSKGTYNVDGPEVTIFGALTESASTVYVGSVAITNFKYSAEGSSKYGYLTWSTTDNATGGDISFYVNSSLIRNFSGSYWKKGETKPSSGNWVGYIDGRSTPHSSYSQNHVVTSSGGGGNKFKQFWTGPNIVNMIAMGVLLMVIIGIGKWAGEKYGPDMLKSMKEKYNKLKKKFKREKDKLDDDDPNEKPMDNEDDPNNQLQSSKLEEESGINNNSDIQLSNNPKLDNENDLLPSNNNNTSELIDANNEVSVDVHPPTFNVKAPKMDLDIPSENNSNANSSSNPNESPNNNNDDADIDVVNEDTVTLEDVVI